MTDNATLYAACKMERSGYDQAEICSLDDLEATIQLLVEFVQSLGEGIDLRPFHFDMSIPNA